MACQERMSEKTVEGADRCAALLDNWTTAQAHAGTEIADAGKWVPGRREGPRRWRT